jgi:hypothetical protein
MNREISDSFEQLLPWRSNNKFGTQTVYCKQKIRYVKTRTVLKTTAKTIPAANTIYEAASDTYG